MGNEPVIRRRIAFYGAVQGVGFRWRAKNAARAYGCTGWCRNEWDGSVTMEVQGPGRAVDQVISALENGSFIRIERMETIALPPDESERDFTCG